MRGRKPTPTKLKILRGNPGKRPVNDREPHPRQGIPKCPQHLDDEARREWRRATKELAAIGMLCHVDRADLAAYCQCWSRWVKMEEIVQRSGEVLVSKTTKRRESKTGVIVTEEASKMYTSPYMKVLNATLIAMHKFASEFGMSPASRVRLSTPGAGQSDDPFEDYLDRANNA